MPNKPDAVNPAMAPRLAVEDHRRRVTDLERSLKETCENLMKPRPIISPKVLLLALPVVVLALTRHAHSTEALAATTSNPIQERSSLSLKIVPPSEPLEVGADYEVHVEVHNGSLPASGVFISGLRVHARFHPAEGTARENRTGPMTFTFDDRPSTSSPKDFVVLGPGRYYGLTISGLKAHAAGTWTYEADYTNSVAGLAADSPAWRGKLHSNPVSVKILP